MAGGSGGLQPAGPSMKALGPSRELCSPSGDLLLRDPKAPLKPQGLFDLCLLSKKWSPGFWPVAHGCASSYAWPPGLGGTL